VVIVGTNGPFRGFLVQARSTPIGNLIGEFTVGNPNLQQTLNCDPMGVATQVRKEAWNAILVFTFKLHFK